MCFALAGYSQNSAANPLLADPAIFFNDGIYYLYGTGGNKDDGFKVFTSKDLEIWEDKGYVLKKAESFGSKGFWAPQVFQYRAKFYMAYTANEHIAIAVADNPLGPFTQNKIQPVSSAVRIIDPFIFFDNNKVYLYHVRLQDGNRIFVAEMYDDLSAIKESTLKECISAEQAWEDTQNANWKVTEGPAVFKKDGMYYMMYSANDFRNPDYAVGYATATSPTGPWKKYPGNPIIATKLLGQNGTGHGDIIMQGKKIFYVLHTHFSNEKVSPRKTAIVELKFVEDKNDIRPEAISSTFKFLLVK